MEFPDGTTPLCSRIYVFAPNSKQSDIVQYNGQVEYGWRNSIAPRIPRDLTSLLEHHNGQEANEYLLERVTVVVIRQFLQCFEILNWGLSWIY